MAILLDLVKLILVSCCFLLQGNYLIPGACCVLILKIFDIPAYVSPTNFPAVIALFLLYGSVLSALVFI